MRKKLTISKLTFLNNTAEQRGGAIDVKFLYFEQTHFSDLQFINNQVTNELGKDGALAFEKIYGLKIYSSKFIHNNAEYGGSMYLNKTEAISNDSLFLDILLHLMVEVYFYLLLTGK